MDDTRLAEMIGVYTPSKYERELEKARKQYQQRGERLVAICFGLLIANGLLFTYVLETIA